MNAAKTAVGSATAPRAARLRSAPSRDANDKKTRTASVLILSNSAELTDEGGEQKRSCTTVGGVSASTSWMQAARHRAVVSESTLHRISQTYHNGHELAFSYWGVHQLLGMCEVHVPPTQLEALLRSTLFASVDDAVSLETLPNFFVSEDAFVWLVSELTSSRLRETDKSLLALALLENRTSSHSLLGIEGVMDVVQSALGERSKSTNATSAVLDSSIHTTPRDEKVEASLFSDEDVERLWSKLFENRKQKESKKEIARKTEDPTALSAFANLSKELQAMLLQQAQESELTSEASNNFGRFASEQRASPTRISQHLSVRKQFLHKIDYSKLGDEAGSISNVFSNVLEESIGAIGEVPHTFSFVAGAVSPHSSGSSSPASPHSPTIPPHVGGAINALPVAEDVLLSILQKSTDACEAILGNKILSEDDERQLEKKLLDAQLQREALLKKFVSSENQFVQRKRATRLSALRDMIQSSRVSTTGSSSHNDGAALKNLFTPWRSKIDSSHGDPSCGGSVADDGDCYSPDDGHQLDRPQEQVSEAALIHDVDWGSRPATAPSMLVPKPTRELAVTQPSATEHGSSSSRLALKQSTLTAEEKRLLFSKRLSTNALLREVAVFPDSVVRYLPTETARKAVLQIKGHQQQSCLPTRKSAPLLEEMHRPQSCGASRPGTAMTIPSITVIDGGSSSSSIVNSGQSTSRDAFTAESQRSGVGRPHRNWQLHSAICERQLSRPTSSASTAAHPLADAHVRAPVHYETPAHDAVSWSSCGGPGSAVTPPTALVHKSLGSWNRWMAGGQCL